MPLKTLCLIVFVATASAATTGCASGGTPAASPSAEAPATRRNRDIITRAEIGDPGMSAMSVYEAIQSLRPNFLSRRGTQGLLTNESGPVLASIDGAPVIAVEELKRLHLNGVVEIRLLSPAAAMQKFGGSAKQGSVILVSTM